MNFAAEAALAAAICLDAIGFGQFMLSRPVVVGPLFGWIFGHLELGALIGAALELIWIQTIPVGHELPPDPAVTAMLAVSWCAHSKTHGNEMSQAGLALALAVPCGMFFKRTDLLLRRAFKRLAHLGDLWARRGREDLVMAIPWFALGINFIKNFAAYGVFSFLGGWLFMRLAPWLFRAPILSRGLGFSLELFAMVGLALAANLFWSKRRDAA